MTTSLTIIKDAMVEIGAIGMVDTPEPEDSAHALRLLNRMIDALGVRGVYAYHTDWIVYTLPAATQTRTIGSGGNINTTRPVRLETGSFTRVSSIDRELKIATRDQWAMISQKTLDRSWPEWVYYEASSPLGTLHFWPQGACDVHLAIQQRLTAFADLSTDYTLPPGIEDMLTLSLSERLCRPFGRPIPGTLAQAAANARRAVKTANAQVPELDMPVGARVGSYAEFLAG
jgi:hypothetical protein